MSTPGVNPALNPPASTTTTTTPSIWGGLMSILALFGGLFGLLIHFAAAKLSYDKYQSPFWAVIDFIFGTIYIPYYAFFLNTPTTPAPMMGGRHKRR